MWIEKTMEPRFGLRNEGTKEDKESVQSTTNELVSTGDGPGLEKIELAHFFERATLFYLFYYPK
jgi:hypothetical protein